MAGGQKSQNLVSRPCTGIGAGKRIAEKGCVCVHKDFNYFPTESEMESSSIRNVGRSCRSQSWSRRCGFSHCLPAIPLTH